MRKSKIFRVEKNRTIKGYYTIKEIAGFIPREESTLRQYVDKNIDCYGYRIFSTGLDTRDRELMEKGANSNNESKKTSINGSEKCARTSSSGYTYSLPIWGE